ncbi:hypothetical protein GGI19_007116, partial [Coemansia pectinata]
WVAATRQPATCSYGRRSGCQRQSDQRRRWRSAASNTPWTERLYHRPCGRYDCQYRGCRQVVCVVYLKLHHFL